MTSGAPLVDRVVDAVTAIDGVAGLYAGGAGSPATYLPGRSVRGIRIGDDGGVVHVVAEARGGRPLTRTAERVRDIATEAAGVPMNVVIADVAYPEPDSGAYESKEWT
ncbi:hypothetical protein [Tsukamurella sp. 1534]|uniref:hypothetical protein n=1 Tax=Tsukamurella sp. 1534 TaxID=1151061 RepID=UPI0002DDAC30|nr:hypothetical protein [Tsukamurella sp. 1534]